MASGAKYKSTMGFRGTYRIINRAFGVFLAICAIALTLEFLRFDKIEIDGITYYHHGEKDADMAALNQAVQKLLMRSELYDGNLTARVILTDSFTEFTFFAPRTRMAFGVTYPGLGLSIIQPASILDNITLRGQVGRSTRKLDGLVAHELVHVMIARHFGGKGRHIPRWKVEGYADIIAQDASLPHAIGVKRLCGSIHQDGQMYQYFEYGQMVGYLLNMGLSFGDIIAQDLDVDDLRQKIKKSLCAEN
ncbi:MAG: hypothetical protein V3V13_00460 [Paracoccaceae bacterium]